MPVLVNAAHRPLARLLVERLLEEGGQVRALARSGVAGLRAAGVFTAVGDPDDEGLLEAACTGVHTLIHLSGGLGGDPGSVRAEGLAAAAAAEGAGVRRVLLLTMSGADPRSPDPLRRAHAEVAAAVAAADVPSVEVRVGLVDTAPVRALLRAVGPPVELRARPVSPVAARDLVEVLVALDAARSRATDGHLVIAAKGSGATLEDLIAGGGGRRGARLPAPWVRDALLVTLAGPWVEEDPTVPSAWELLGLAPGRDPSAGGPS